MTDKFNILDYTDGPLLKTGQVTSYTPAGRTSGDDGVNERGIRGSKEDDQYQILTSGQYSGTTNITIGAVVDAHSNECVVDKVTGLMWNRQHSKPIYSGLQNLFWDDSAGIDEDIFEFCDQANNSSLSGFNDWRVPNSVECHSLFIYDAAVVSPRLNKTAFNVFVATILYTSTTNPANTAFAYRLDLSTGALSATNKTAFRYPVLLCRLGIES